MKAVLLVSLSTFFLSGCIYTHPSPYGYSHTVVAPHYQRYEVPRYYTPAPAPRFRYFENRPRFRSHSRRRHW